MRRVYGCGPVTSICAMRPGSSGPTSTPTLRDGQLSRRSCERSVPHRDAGGSRTRRSRNCRQLTDDRETAYSALFERFVESNETPISTKLVLAGGAGRDPAELRRLARRVCRRSARGARERGGRARRARRRAPPRARAGRRCRAVRRAPTRSRPSTSSYPDLSGAARPVEAASRRGSVRSRQGFAISEVAPSTASSTSERGKASVVRTSEGSFTVKPLDDALPLGAVPLGKATPAIAAALRSFNRGEAFEKWTVGEAARPLLNTAICAQRRPPAAVRRRPDFVPALPQARVGAAPSQPAFKQVAVVDLRLPAGSELGQTSLREAASPQEVLFHQFEVRRELTSWRSSLELRKALLSKVAEHLAVSLHALMSRVALASFSARQLPLRHRRPPPEGARYS